MGINVVFQFRLCFGGKNIFLESKKTFRIGTEIRAEIWVRLDGSIWTWVLMGALFDNPSPKPI